MKNILERDLGGEPVSVDDPDYGMIKAVIANAKRLTQQMNTSVCDAAAVRRYFGELTGREVGDDFNLNLPFYTDAVIGAGSVVTKNVEAGTVVAGNPAKPIGTV